MKRFSVKFLTLLLAIALTLPGMAVYADSGLVLECTAPFWVFEGNSAVNFVISSSDEAYVSVTDYWGNTVFDETVESGEFSIPDLDNGWYQINAENGSNTVSRTFSVVPKLSKRRDSSNSAVAFSAMASHTYSSRDKEADYAKSIALAGVPYVREFCNYNEIWDPSEGSGGGIRAAKLLSEYKKNDIDVMYMFQHMPGADASTDGHYITDDLLHVYDTVQEVCRQHGDKIDALEILNEVDVNHYKDAPERYAAVLKAASIALGDYEGDIRIGNSGFVGSRGYIKKFLQNEVEKYIDIYNTHFYLDYNESDNVCVYPETLDELSFEAGNYALVDRNMWLSEYGLRIPYEEDRLNVSYPDLTEEQQLRQARTAPTAIIKAQAAGVDKAFWFIHGYILENGKSYGTMTSDNTPHMVYSSVAALTNALGNAKYWGNFNSLPSDVYGYCFKEGNEEVGCFWAEDSASITLSINGDSAIVSDIMGNETTVEADGGQLTLNIGPDIVYVRTGDGFEEEYIDEVKAFEKEIFHPSFSKSEKVVLLPLFDDETKDRVTVDGYKLSATDSNVVRVKVYNLNNEEMSGNITATPSGGWTVASPVQEVTVPAMSYVEVEFLVNCNDSVARRTEVPLVFNGEFNGEKTSDTVCHIMTTDPIYITPDTIINAYNWGKSTGYGNSDGANTVSRDGDVVKMACNFTGVALDSRAVGCKATDKVFYPVPDFSGSDGFVVEYKTDNELSTLVRLWALDADGDLFYSHTPWNLETSTSQSLNLTGEWQQVIYPWDSLNVVSVGGDGVLNLADCDITLGIKPQNEADVTFNVYFRNAGLYTSEMAEVPEVSCTDVVYSGTQLCSTYNNSYVKAAKHIINGKVYDVSLNGTAGTVEIVLPEGVHDVTTVAFDAANKASVFTSSLDVVRSAGEYTVTYDANGGIGVPEAQIKLAGENIKLSEQIPYADNAVFNGWSTDRYATSPEYYPGDVYSNDESVVLYALWSEGTSLNYKEAAQYTSEQHAIIKGFAGPGYAGKRAAVFVYKSNADLDDFDSEDLIYINETQIASDGNYIFDFPMNESVSGYSYVLSVDGKIITGTMECVEYCYKWYDTSISITSIEGRLLVTAIVKNHSRVETEYVFIISSYDSDGNLIEVISSEETEENIKRAYQVPKNAAVVKAFLWSDYENIIPLNIPAVKAIN